MKQASLTRSCRGVSTMTSETDHSFVVPASYLAGTYLIHMITAIQNHLILVLQINCYHAGSPYDSIMMYKYQVK